MKKTFDCNRNRNRNRNKYKEENNYIRKLEMK